MPITTIDDVCQNFPALIDYINSRRSSKMAAGMTAEVNEILNGLGWDNARAVVEKFGRLKTLPSNVPGELERLWEEHKRSMVTHRDYSGHRQADTWNFGDDRRRHPNAACVNCGGTAVVTSMRDRIQGKYWIFWDCIPCECKPCDCVMGCGYKYSKLVDTHVLHGAGASSKQLTVKEWWE